MGSRTLNRKSLLALYKLPVFGGEDEDEDEDEDEEDEQGKQKPAEKPKPSDSRKSGQKKPDEKKTDEEEPDEDDFDDFNEYLKSIKDPKERRIAQLSKQKLERRKQYQEEKEKNATLQAEIDSLKGKPGEERLAAELQAEKDKNAKLTESVSNSIIRSGINENDKFTWHNVSVVMGLLDRSQIEVDLEEGVADGLEKQLAKLAKENPYLLKKKTGGQGSGEDGSGSTGSNPRGGRKNGQEVTDRDRLIAKYNKVLH